MDRIQELKGLFRRDWRFSSTVVDIPPDKWPTEDGGWVCSICGQIPPSPNNDAPSWQYAALILPHIARVVFSFIGVEFNQGDALETLNALLLWETMNATVEVRCPGSSGGAVECLEFIPCGGDGVGRSCLARSRRGNNAVWIGVEESLELVGPAVGSKFVFIEEEGQVLAFDVSTISSKRERAGSTENNSPSSTIGSSSFP